MYTVSITSQGQISLPAKIRRELGIRKNGKAIIAVEKGKVTIEPVQDLLELGGSLKTSKKPLTSEEIHEFVATAIADEYGRKMK